MCKLRFITIGFVEPHKGHDILLNAIKQIDDKLLAECEFFWIGNKSSLFAKEIQNAINDMPYISMPGTVSRKDIHTLLSESDILICPSREDSMPTVCAEAMMHSVPCLVSDAVGTAEYIADGIDGLVFKNENTMELAEKIIWCINHKSELKNMGKKAYHTYDKVFSMSAFEKNLMKYVNDMLE